MTTKTLTWTRDGSVIRLHREEHVSDESPLKTIEFRLEVPYRMFPTPDGKSAISNVSNFREVVFPDLDSNGVTTSSYESGKCGKFDALVFHFNGQTNADAKTLNRMIEMANTFQEFICTRIDGLFDEVLRVKSEVAHLTFFAKGTLAGLLFIRGDVSSLDLQAPLPEKLKQELKAEVRYFSKVTLWLILSVIFGIACIAYSLNGGDRYFTPGRGVENAGVLLFFVFPLLMIPPVFLLKPRRRHGSPVSSDQSYSES